MNETFSEWEFCFIKKIYKEKKLVSFKGNISEAAAKDYFRRTFQASPIRHQNAILCSVKGVR